MKILILGGNGMLGHKLLQILSDKFEVSTTIRSHDSLIKNIKSKTSGNIFESVEAGDLVEIERIVKAVKPSVMINAIGLVKQNNDVSESEFYQINAQFPHRLYEIAKKYHARLICISTDCVFDGQKGNYAEEETPNATDIYGKSKILGEVLAENCLTIRTSIIGREIGKAHGLVEWFLRNQNSVIDGYKNAWFSGLPTVVLAEILSEIISDFPRLQGIYHLSAAPINKFELLNLIKSAFGSTKQIQAFEDFHINRTLNSEKFLTATGIKIPNWNKLVNRMFEDSIKNANIYE